MHSALFTMLRAGLWESDIDDISCFPLSDGEWRQVFVMSRQQTVTGLVFRGLQYLPDEMLPSDGLLIRWTAEADAIERKNRGMNKVLSGLYTLFRSQELNPVLQKGQGVARFYEMPLLRECGDIDLYFNSPKSMSAAASCIQRTGASLKAGPYASLFYVFHGIEVEHHSRLFDLYSPFLRYRADRLEADKGYETFQLLSGTDVRITVPSPFLNLLLLDLHILKHSLGWGVGLRQLCDMARACHKLHGKVNHEEMKRTCRSFGLKKWNPLLHAFLTEYLGLPFSALPYPETAPDARPLLDIVLKGGNFGYRLAERSSQGQSVLKRKIRTAQSFCKNMPFVIRYAPREAFWMVAGLLKGQFK